jgi:ABC-type transport system involved in multi-copper enzyme maturation permease subunit
MVKWLLDWVRAWSNSRQAWRERFGFAVLALGAAFFIWSAGRLTLASQIFLCCLWLVALTVLLRRGWYTLCGPVLLYELVRTTRRSRFTLYRFYAYFVLILLAAFFAGWYWRLRETGRMPLNDTAALAAGFFYALLSLQIVVTALLTPAYTAGIIAEEKERRTLEYLLATDLRNREIVLSRLVSRLANLLLMLLTGVPIFSFIEFAGGVEPDLVLVGFVATAATMVSVASLSALTSVYARKSWQGLLYAYLAAAAYVAISSLARVSYTTVLPTLSFMTPGGQITAANLLDWLMVGNPFLQLMDLSWAMAGGSRLGDSLASRLGEYLVFHGVATVLCAGWAILRLRAVFLKQADFSGPSTRKGARRRLRPRVGTWPMLWKEVVVEGALRFRLIGRLMLILLVLASFGSLGWIWTMAPGAANGVSRIYVWAVVVGAAVACLLLLGVAARAAASLTSERDRQTLDGLLTTPLDSTTILFAKWLGSILSIRWGWLWLGGIWALGIELGNLHPLAVLRLLLAFFIYAALLATLGLWFSLICQTTRRALVWTFLCSAALGIGFLLVPVSFLFPTPGLGTYNRLLDWLPRLQMGLTPPVVLAHLLPYWKTEGWPTHSITKHGWEDTAAFWGLAIWALAAAILWVLTSRRFRKVTCREARRRPERAAEIELPVASPRKQLASP